MDIFSVHFWKYHPYAERFLDFFSILTMQQRYFDMQDQYVPKYSLRLKVIPPRMEIRYFFMQMRQPDIHQNGSALAELGRIPSIASANKECSTIFNKQKSSN